MIWPNFCFIQLLLNLENDSSLHEAAFLDLVQVWAGSAGSVWDRLELSFEALVCACVCFWVWCWPLTAAKPSLSVETSQVNTDSQWSVNRAPPLVTLKPALSVGQLPGYIHTVRPSSQVHPSQHRGNRAPELSLSWKQMKCAIKNVCVKCCLEHCETKQTKYIYMYVCICMEA